MEGRGVNKIFFLLPLLAVSCLFAGLYGVVHNQISYTVSPDYFHAFKFDQFSIPDSLRGRVGASIVGWEAAWWMGIVIGEPVVLVGLILPGWRAYVTQTLMAFVVAATTALVVGLGGLAYACFSIGGSSLPPFVYPVGIDRVSFARAGLMHDFSYLGGLLGIVVAVAYLVVVRFRPRQSRKPRNTKAA
jgi:hypothetical protein